MPSIPEDDDRIYINEAAKILNRKKGTIRMWERTGKLPKRLIPQRGYQGWRCWTETQVYGKNGLIAWMKKNDMRPGSHIAHPDSEEAHLASLRQPKTLTGYNIIRAKNLAEAGRDRHFIVKRVLENSPYYERVERMLEQIFEHRDWYFPPSTKQRRKDPELSRKQKSDLERIEKAISKIDK